LARIRIGSHDALIVVDMQRDFMPGGALPVPEADKIVPTINSYIELFNARGALIAATRDWHPENHISFKTRGGPWPPHCIRGTPGAEFHPDLRLPSTTVIISKATDPDKEAYSGFDGTELHYILSKRRIRRVFVCGVATDYCVRATVIDGLELGYQVFVLQDAIRGVNVPPGSIERAVREMLEAGAVFVTREELE